MFRLSNNSRSDHSYQPIDPDSINTPNKDLSSGPTPGPQVKPLYTPSQDGHSAASNDRMVSPKRKIDHIPHLYVANNVKTSTFNGQVDKNNLANSKSNLIHEFSGKFGCSHTPISMVPERDTGPSKISSVPVNTVGSLRLPSAGKFKAESGGIDEHRSASGRQHHHVSVQELRLQVISII